MEKSSLRFMDQRILPLMTPIPNNRPSPIPTERRMANGSPNTRLLQFNHSSVMIPGVGNVTIKSQYRRLKPEFERKPIHNSDTERLCAKVYDWLDYHFVLAGREEYFREIALSIVLFTVYTNPLPELHSDEMDLCIKIFGWLWFFDDVLEVAIDNGVPFDVLKEGNNKIASILLGKYDSDKCKCEDVPGYPLFKPMFNSYLELHNICRKTVPEYGKRILFFHGLLLKFFDVHVTSGVDRIDGRHSEENFSQFRKVMAFMDGAVEIVALLRGVTLSDEILRNPTLRRLLDIVNAVGGYANDLCGMKKEFENGQQDNIVVFKVMEKNIPIEVAVQQVCELVESELSDYVLLKEVFLKEFHYDKNLVRYLGLLDAMCDGHHRMYVQSKRHRCAGSITLTE